ncbi:MAG: enoyl-CoA hydratase/isomerase family protein [Candidatus Xenobia bacterium]
MGPEQCRRLQAAIRAARQRPTRTIVLESGRDFWSNGLHLNLIEAADSPADASWENIQAMNDLTLEILSTQPQVTVASIQGNAGAGGVFFALAADYVLARPGVVLNPHYQGMGGLYGSEYWTYLLPRRVGVAKAEEIMRRRLPMGTEEARRIGLIDAAVGDGKRWGAPE